MLYATFMLLALPSAFTAAVFVIGVLGTFLSLMWATHKIWLYAFLRRKAKRKIVVRNVQEGTAVLVKQNEEAVRALTSKAKTDPDEYWNVASDVGKTVVPEEKKLRPFTPLEAEIDAFLPGGMRWKGFEFQGYEFFNYNFRWEVLRSSHPGDGKEGRPLEEGLVDMRDLENGKWVASFAQRIDYIFLRDSVYYFEVTGAETKGRKGEKDTDPPVPGMSLTLRCEMTCRIVNPYLTLINIHDWLESVFGLLRPSLRAWVASHYYEEIQGKLEVAQREYDDFLNITGVAPERFKELQDKGLIKADAPPPKTLRDYIECTYGVRIKRIAFDDIIAPPEYVAESTARAAAEQAKVRIELQATAEKNRQLIVAEGEAGRLAAVSAVMEKSDVARELRRLEAMEKMSEGEGTTIVLGSENANVLLNAPKKGGSN